MLINQLLKNIKKDANFKKSILGAKKGIDFEINIQHELTSQGFYTTYPSEKFKKHPNFKKFKKMILESTDSKCFIQTDLFDDIVGNSPRIVYQPFGKQASPDFLFLRKGKALALECKFTEKKIKAPVWNSGLPKRNFNYIFGSLLLTDTTFFSGNKILLDNERNSIIKLVNEKRKELKNEGLKITNKFYIYLRPMYNQKQNSWKTINREVYEDDFIKEVESFEK